MRRNFLIIILVAFSFQAFATRQSSDILIIGNDTIFLQTFPLESIRRDNNFSPPFMYGDFPFPHTANWRGYIATWGIVESFLVLKEIAKTNSDSTLNIIEYFKSNNYNPKIINGFVVADWYSATLIRCRFSRDFSRRHDRLFLNIYHSRLNAGRAKLVFENGKLVRNNIASAEN